MFFNALLLTSWKPLLKKVTGKYDFDISTGEFDDNSHNKLCVFFSFKFYHLILVAAYRGLAISVMIFVNYGGGSYYFFNHSPWNGEKLVILMSEKCLIWVSAVRHGKELCMKNELL